MFSAIKRHAYLKNKKCSLFQARAPFSEVLIVGTHVDLLPKNNRQARADALKHSIVKKYLDNQGFPKIVGNIMVSPVTGENIPELKEMIYSKALKVKDNGENIIGRRVSWTRKSPPPPPLILLFHYDNICSLGSKQITHMISACMSHFFLRTLITDFFPFLATRINTTHIVISYSVDKRSGYENTHIVKSRLFYTCILNHEHKGYRFYRANAME